MEDVILNRNKGAIAAIGCRFNSQLSENTVFYQRFLNATYGGEYLLGKIYSSAKLYSHYSISQNRSRRTPSNLPLGDIMLFGDPAMVVNTPNSDAPLAVPSNLNLMSDSGKLVMQWSSVPGADGYAISASSVKAIAPWTIFTTQNNIKLADFTGMSLEHNVKYYVSVKAYKTKSNVRSFNRGPACSGEIILDKYVAPPENVSADGYGDLIRVTFSASPDGDIKAYKVYRALYSSQSSFDLLSSSAVSPFIDNTCNPRDCYVYYVSAVDNCNNESEKVATTPIKIISYIEEIMGFENSDLWFFIFGSTGVLSNNTLHTEGSVSLNIAGNGFQQFSSPNINTTLIGPQSKFDVDIFVGTNQPNPDWIGQLQLYINCPSASINNLCAGAVELTGLQQGTFNNIEFTLPANVRSVLNGDYDDLSFSFALNTNAGSGPYMLDNIKFSDEATFPDPNKWYKIATRANTSLCFDVTGGNYATNTAIELWTKSNVNQEFKFNDAGNGYYTITCRANTDYSIDMSGNFAIGQELKLWYSQTSNANQKFKLVPITDGYYRLETSNSSFSIDNWGAGGNGVKPALFTSNNNNVNQQWLITEVQ